MLSLAPPEAAVPEIVKTVATDDKGIDELLAAIEAFRAQAEKSGLLAQKQRAHLRQQFEETLRERVLHRLERARAGRRRARADPRSPGRARDGPVHGRG